MSTSGPNTFLFKKYTRLLNHYSPECVAELERIYTDYGAHAGYTAALAIINYKEQVESTGQREDTTRYVSYLRQYPSAVARLKRAFDCFLDDVGLSESSAFHD